MQKQNKYSFKRAVVANQFKVWLVREATGIYLDHYLDGWMIELQRDPLPEATEVWGDNWQNETHPLWRLPAYARGPHRTRAQALEVMDSYTENPLPLGDTQLTLARFPGTSGDSRGSWLVKQMPGFYIQHCRRGWSLRFADHVLRGKKAPNLTWGKGWNPRRDIHTRIGLTPAWESYYPTRTQALMALQSFISEDHSELSEMLTP